MVLQSTANTIQTENQFLSIQWTVAFVLRSIEELFKNYPIKAVKIGIVPSLLFARNSVSTKGFKKQACLGHRSKIKYRIRLSQYRRIKAF
jgi:hypothetical protein